MAVNPFEQGKNTPISKEEPMADNINNEAVTLTFKGGRGYDVPWGVARYPSWEEANKDLEENQDTIVNTLTNAAKANAKFIELVTKYQGDTPAAAPSKPPQQSAPGGETRNCSHGEMVFKSGVSKAGKPWKAFMCSAPKDDPSQCSPQWLR